MGFGYFDYGYAEWEDEEKLKKLTEDSKVCYHEWVQIMLLTSYVYDCKKCGSKREEVEKCSTT